MGKIRVVLVDDSSLMRGLLRTFLEEDDDIEIVGEAGNGREAVTLARELKPNLMTMDLEMPVMNGMQAIEEIMATKAVPILVVSSVADAHNAYEAVARGALEVIAKPEYEAKAAAEFVAKVKMLAGVSVITHIRSRLKGKETVCAPQSPSAQPPLLVPQDNVPVGYSRIFAIASSLGGPQALALVLAQLPADFPCPILVSQHIAAGFAGGMADWLAGLCKLRVCLAQEGELIVPGVVYVSPSETNLVVTRSRRITLQEQLPAAIYHPSCNALLNAVAEVYGCQGVGIILTGMGSDGAQGIACIRKVGGTTLAQDEASSVIFGMNKVAIDSGSVQKVLPADAIAREMIGIASACTVASQP
ncbi:MAG: chemotaxis-specific protein-glutamate methyltransferase CheB [Proteobacteria bacterium]|jgi:two-component system chemotaxis response regulator CheB|nr:chemotaxis-specific protein-glutamate methyltransferase CheB [Desulfocapsa sp.]MBU3945867.1 chemotaxis-specific protein-glutamate methyltransferase CheB [Pseudomonadota bacterium]MCG2745608.1 chemotaxis-specific protein-glutamate methyltransferase CheB [Desulfobacteraceae bacterium]MBU3982786.1 chemotaxis-specific protein-glutamate methyltransferase CheB [Pseudomonadota bacterium]MBU4027714.1 chemotaxis-specific protein-glutamate methyltransferase CheB [Pseudomonadota bacterium]